MGLWSKTKEIILKSIPTAVVSDWITRSPQWTTWDAQTAIREGYKSNPWVYACIKLRADSVASVPLVVEQLTGEDWEAVEKNHPLQKLLNNPNSGIDSGELRRLLVTHLDLAGNAYLLKTRLSNNRIGELWTLYPQFMRPIPSRLMLIGSYEYMPINGQREIIPAEDMVHLSYCNPESMFIGMSPLEACGKSVDVDNKAAEWQKVNMSNRGVPDGVFMFDDLTPDQFEQVKDKVKERFATGNREPWTMSKGKYQQMAYTPLEADFSNTRLHALKQICSAFGVPVDMIAGQGDANLASSTQVRKSFWEDTITPLCDQIAKGLTMALCKEYGDNLRIRFDLTAVPAMQTNTEEKLANADRLLKLGYTLNEINQHLELGMEDAGEDGNIRYVPSGLIPMSMLDPEDDPVIAGEEAYGQTDSE
jgi:HK97 family phage portal protein